MIISFDLMWFCMPSAVSFLCIYLCIIAYVLIETTEIKTSSPRKLKLYKGRISNAQIIFEKQTARIDLLNTWYSNLIPCQGPNFLLSWSLRTGLISSTEIIWKR